MNLTSMCGEQKAGVLSSQVTVNFHRLLGFHSKGLIMLHMIHSHLYVPGCLTGIFVYSTS
jgi:hypothetical protein